MFSSMHLLLRGWFVMIMGAMAPEDGRKSGSGRLVLEAYLIFAADLGRHLETGRPLPSAKDFSRLSVN